jgi:hypothetical protein
MIPITNQFCLYGVHFEPLETTLGEKFIQLIFK